MAKQEKNNLPEMYTEEQLDALEDHIEQYFGKYENVFHEIYSPDIHLDVIIIPPTPERNWITLVTEGMGAHEMHVPDELANSGLDRAELLICLPPDWNLNSSEEKDYWPIRLLKSLARLPIECDTWLGWGHTIDQQESFDQSTELCGTLLLSPGVYGEDAGECELPDGICVNFYQIFPIYQEEMTFKQEYGANALLDLMVGAVGHIVDPQRYNVSKNDDDILDWQSWHVGSIREKKLPLDEITGYNHMAIYLRWCIEHDMMCSQFCIDFAEAVDAVKAHDDSCDLRALIQNDLSGRFPRYIFNEEGQAFATYYYDHSHAEGEPCYPSDVDDYALHYFGEEKYHCDEFMDEAYLFVPYDEAYYQGMKQYIDYYYDQWQNLK